MRPHLGVMGVVPREPGRRSSIPPGVFGGNVDNWRFGPGAVVRYPVLVEGARFYIGDPHFAQGDGEICGTAIEASLDVRLRLSVERRSRRPCWRRRRTGSPTASARTSVPPCVDIGVTQVVDATLGCHAAIPKSLL